MSLYKVRINFKKPLIYGDRSGPGVPFSSAYHEYTAGAEEGKERIIGLLQRNGGVWTGHASEYTLWVPYDMFESVELTLQRR